MHTLSACRVCHEIHVLRVSIHMKGQLLLTHGERYGGFSTTISLFSVLILVDDHLDRGPSSILEISHPAFDCCRRRERMPVSES